MLRSLVALALVLATPALARTYDRAEIIRGLCRPDGCDEFAILAASPLTKGGEGTLLETRVKTFHTGTVNLTPKRQSCRGRSRYASTHQPMKAAPVASRQVAKA
jgi:hypothetical protein